MRGEKRDNGQHTREPIANPLPMALVVFPTESSSSVLSRTFFPSSPHLGDAARIVRNPPDHSVHRHHHGRHCNIETAAMAMPRKDPDSD